MRSGEQRKPDAVHIFLDSRCRSGRCRGGYLRTPPRSQRRKLVDLLGAVGVSVEAGLADRASLSPWRKIRSA